MRFSDPPKVTQQTGPFPSPLTWFKSFFFDLVQVFDFPLLDYCIPRCSRLELSKMVMPADTARLVCLLSLRSVGGVFVPLFASDGP